MNRVSRDLRDLSGSCHLYVEVVMTVRSVDPREMCGHISDNIPKKITKKLVAQ